MSQRHGERIEGKTGASETSLRIHSNPIIIKVDLGTKNDII